MCSVPGLRFRHRSPWIRYMYVSEHIATIYPEVYNKKNSP